MELVERAPLLTQLGGLLARARAGSGSVVLLGGEAGVGKTSAARAFVAREAAALRVLWGSCEPLVTPEPLGPFHDMAPLASVLAAQPSRVDLLAALLNELRGVPTTVMVVDDAHWADEATLDALRFLGRRIHGVPGMLVVTFREDEMLGGSPLRAVLGDLATAPGCHRLHVAPLTAAAVTDLAAGHAVEPGRLYSATGGNPFYVTEVLAAEGWTVPPTVSDAVLARASRLDPVARTVLEVVSLAPGGLEPTVAVELSGGDAGALDSCVERGMLVLGAERVTFRHELARLAVAGSVPISRRRRLHLELLEQLERVDGVDPARLAHHAEAAGDGAAVLLYAPLAARDASQRGAHRAAAEHLERAVASAETLAPGSLASLISAWADERMTFDDPREVLALRLRTVELNRNAGDRLGEARELLELGRMARRLGDAAVEQVGDPALDPTGQSALDILEQLPPGPELAKALAFKAFGDTTASRFDEAMRAATRAIEVDAPGGPTSATIVALRIQGNIENLRDRSAASARAYREARRLATAAGDLDLDVAIVIDMANELAWRRRYPEAISRYREAIELGRAVDLDYRVSQAEALLAQIDFAQGRWTDAERVDLGLLRDYRHHPNTRMAAMTDLGRLRVRRGDPDAVSMLEAAAAITDQGEASDPWEVAAGLAEAAWLDGRRGEIRALVGDHYERLRAESLTFPPSRWSAGELALLLWRAGALRDVPTDIAEPYALQIAGEWRRAAAAWEAIGCPYEQSDALADGDEPAMRQALAIFSRLGAEPAAARLRERMRRVGVTNIPARPHRSNRSTPAQLTPRQLEIVELLERGLTNGEIAARLFISEKTAGHHVSAILAKLGARSRTEAASTARKMGIVPSETSGGRPKTRPGNRTTLVLVGTRTRRWQCRGISSNGRSRAAWRFPRTSRAQRPAGGWS
jgi:DNA-binding CsgD family transcriptional regulator/tetratricopeptide (TPR) repeat protein